VDSVNNFLKKSLGVSLYLTQCPWYDVGQMSSNTQKTLKTEMLKAEMGTELSVMRDA
jgi:hypothetical protein